MVQSNANLLAAAGFPWGLVALLIGGVGVITVGGYLIYLWGRARHDRDSSA